MPSPRPERSGPRRTCVGCGRTTSPDELLRVVRTPEGSLVVGRTLPGRGAWLCAGDPTCLDRAVRRGGFARSFRAPVSREAIEALRPQVTAGSAPPPAPPFVPGTPPARDS